MVQTLTQWIVSQTTAGTVKGIYFYGEAGIGKSALLRTLQGQLQDSRINAVSYDFSGTTTLPKLKDFIFSSLPYI